MKEIGKERYRLYREHKFLRATLCNLENGIAKADFTDPSQVLEIQAKLEATLNVMEHHAKHENEFIHVLLRAKGSNLIDSIERDHENYISLFADLKTKIEDVLNTTNEQALIDKGYQFYIAFRKFVAIDLNHINEEETVIMLELQKFYSDEELKKSVDFPVYEKMSSEDMVGMMSVLFPHLNVNDKEHFLRDLKESQPEKFEKAWVEINPFINQAEKDKLIKNLKLETRY